VGFEPTNINNRVRQPGERAGLDAEATSRGDPERPRGTRRASPSNPTLSASSRLRQRFRANVQLPQGRRIPHTLGQRIQTAC
jgi:hypothetical protein